MKKIAMWFCRLPLSLPQKFIGIFVLLCMIPMIIVMENSNQNYRKSLENSAANYVRQMTVEMTKKIDDSVLEMRAITLTPYLENSVAYVMQRADYLETQKAISAQFRLMANGCTTNKIYLFDSTGRVYGNMPYKSMRSDIQEQYESFKEVAYGANGRVVIRAMLGVEDNSGQFHNYITLVRSIKELDYYRQLGVIVVDVELDILDEPIQTLNENIGAVTRIVDEDGRIIYDSDNEKVGQLSEMKLPAMGEGGEIISWEALSDGEESLCFASGCQETDWKIIVSVPKRVVFQEAQNTIRIIRTIAYPVMGLAFFLFILLSLTITRPLKKLVLLLEEVQKENFDVQFHVRYNDEIAKVGRSFNFMVKRIRQLFTEVYATKLLYKQTELNALQSQINPHFIYNTLETISMYAVIHHVPVIYDFTQTFGQILRYSIRDINLPVALEQELNHVKNYVSLLECRFPGKYQLNIEVEEELKKVKVLKLMLQPLVENAISHGLENLKDGGTVTITAVKGQGQIIITVRDNGIGMSPEQLLQLQELLLHPDEIKEEVHIGLINVSRRLTLYYGESAHLSLQSEENKGTQVTILFRDEGREYYDKDCNS